MQKENDEAHCNLVEMACDSCTLELLRCKSRAIEESQPCTDCLDEYSACYERMGYPLVRAD